MPANVTHYILLMFSFSTHSTLHFTHNFFLIIKMTNLANKRSTLYVYTVYIDIVFNQMVTISIFIRYLYGYRA